MDIKYKKREKFSIIITTFNRKELLNRAVSSVFNQTYPHFELIIVDDGSKVTHKLESSFCRSNNIKYICHNKNKGVSEARNTGIRKSQNPYIVFLDDDDQLRNIYLERLNSHLKQYPYIDFSWCGFSRKKYRNTELIKQINHIYEENSENSKNVCPMMRYWGLGIGVMIKKYVFDKIGYFDSKLSTSEDTDFLLRMLNNDMNFASIPEILIDVNEDIITKSLSRNIDSTSESKNLMRMIKKNNNFLRKHPNIWGYYMKHLIFSLYRSKKNKDARHQIRKILKYPQIMMSVLPRSLKYEIFSNLQSKYF